MEIPFLIHEFSHYEQFMEGITFINRGIPVQRYNFLQRNYVLDMKIHFNHFISLGLSQK